MREVSSVFQEGLLTGLAVSSTIRTQAQHLTQCYNLVATPQGLEAREEIVNPVNQVRSDWPWPICFCLSRKRLVFTRNEVFLADRDWELQFLAQGDWQSLPHVADFLDTVVWASEGGQWMLTPDNTVRKLTDARFQTCCNFRGQLIVGNGALPKGPERISSTEIRPDSIPVEGENIVGWTKIGAMDWEYTLGNEVGWAPMPWEGPVYALLPLGKEVVVYGANGCAKLAMASNPVTTFGVQDFGDIGVVGPNCVAGDTTAQIFLGQDRALYLVEPERALSGEGKLPKRLGYSDWLQGLVDPIVSFDSAKKHWWIGDKNRSFVFSGAGLSEVSLTPTHLSRVDGILWGCYSQHGSREAIVETGPVSLDSRGIKTLMCVEADMLSAKYVYGWTTWRSHYQQEMRKTKDILVDPRGAFFPVIAGTEFTIGMRTGEFSGFHLTKMWLHHKNTDKTFSRGVINAGRPAE